MFFPGHVSQISSFTSLPSAATYSLDIAIWNSVVFPIDDSCILLVHFCCHRFWCCYYKHIFVCIFLPALNTGKFKAFCMPLLLSFFISPPTVNYFPHFFTSSFPVAVRLRDQRSPPIAGRETYILTIGKNMVRNPLYFSRLTASLVVSI